MISLISCTVTWAFPWFFEYCSKIILKWLFRFLANSLFWKFHNGGTCIRNKLSGFNFSSTAFKRLVELSNKTSTCLSFSYEIEFVPSSSSTVLIFFAFAWITSCLSGVVEPRLFLNSTICRYGAISYQIFHNTAPNNQVFWSFLAGKTWKGLTLVANCSAAILKELQFSLSLFSPTLEKRPLILTTNSFMISSFSSSFLNKPP